MKTKHLLRIILAIGVVSILAIGGWYLWLSSPPAYLTESECINTFEYFAYDSIFEDEPFNEASAGEPWEFITKLPIGEWSSESQIYAMMTRGSSSDQEIWIEKMPFINSEEEYEFLIYHPKQDYWETISAEVENSGVYINLLFIDSEGTLWGRNSPYPKQEQLSTSEYPVLSKFNEQTRQFEFMADSLKVPVLDYPDAFPNQIVLDQNDIFWIYVQLDGLYRYDPQSGVTEKLTKLERTWVDDIAIGIDGNIFINTIPLSFTLTEDEILLYDPELGETTSIAIPEETWPEEGNIFIDHYGNLWIDAAGYRDPEGNWYPMYSDLEQLFEAYVVLDDLAHLGYESSDGPLWFIKASISSLGIAWYNPESGQGCWFTSEVGNVIEDENYTLWLVTTFPEYKLYKLKMR